MARLVIQYNTDKYFNINFDIVKFLLYVNLNIKTYFTNTKLYFSYNFQIIFLQKALLE